MTAGSMDVIVMHSVAQYLSPQELDALAQVFHRLLKPGGLLVVGDVIPRNVSTLADARALLRFGSQEGFYWAALRGLFRTVFSDYWRLRRSLGMTRYDLPRSPPSLRTPASRRSPPLQTSATMTSE